MNKIQHSATRGGVASFGMFKAPNPVWRINGTNPNRQLFGKLQYLNQHTTTSLTVNTATSPVLKPVSEAQINKIQIPQQDAIASSVFSEKTKTTFSFNSKFSNLILSEINGIVFADNEALNNGNIIRKGIGILTI